MDSIRQPSIPDPPRPLPACLRLHCHVTGQDYTARVAEVIGPALWVVCPCHDAAYRTPDDPAFDPDCPHHHAYALDGTPLVRQEHQPIPVIGSVSSPAELVAVLRRAHLDAQAAREHAVELCTCWFPCETEADGD